MLVLGRKEGEKIKIGPDIVIQVIRINGDQVQIGIDAPESVNIIRPEVLARERSRRKE